MPVNFFDFIELTQLADFSFVFFEVGLATECLASTAYHTLHSKDPLGQSFLFDIKR